MNFNSPLVQISIKLLVAILCGGAIGLEREINRKPAGLRTNILICIGATLLMITSRHIPSVEGSGDPARLVAQLVVGIGFVGAGVILRSHEGSVTGLTSAATILVVMAIGVAIGDGMFGAAAITTSLALFVLVVVEHLERFIFRKRRLYHYTFITSEPGKAHSQLLDLLEKEKIHLNDFNLIERDENKHEMGFSIITTPSGHSKLIEKLRPLGYKLSVAMPTKTD